MTVALCVDDRLGRLFGGKRQSRDRRITEELVKESKGRFFILPFSRQLFSSCPEAVLKEDTQEEGFYFLEDLPLAPLASRIEKLILFRWNRHYPSNVILDVTPEALGLRLQSTEEFPGFSHEKITKETYCR